MTTVKARLSAKYIYIRCDYDFMLSFTNGDNMPFWKGFYCLLTEDLQRYNTNNEFDIVSSDDASIWWMSSDTLIMSVNDINTEMLTVISKIADNNAQANVQQLQTDLQQTSLLMSIQNTLSTFLNTYVDLHQVVDYGFQTALIDGGNSCTLYIAKPTGGYTFNCSITYNRSVLISYWGELYQRCAMSSSSRTDAYMKLFVDKQWRDSMSQYPESAEYVNASYGKYSNLFHYMALTDYTFDTSGVTGCHIRSMFPTDVVSIPFVLKNNDNQLLSGYTIGNVNASVQFTLGGSFVVIKQFKGKSYSNWTELSTNYQNLSYSKQNFLNNCSYDSVNGAFVLNGSALNDSVTVGSISSSFTAPSVTENLTINFDVSYTPS